MALRRVIVPRANQDREERERLERVLHDMTNGLAAARSFCEVLIRRSRTARERSDLAPLAESLLKELDRVSDMAREVRSGTHQQGDVLTCADCRYTFVNLRGKEDPHCRRCKGTNLQKWKPAK